MYYTIIITLALMFGAIMYTIGRTTGTLESLQDDRNYFEKEFKSLSRIQSERIEKKIELDKEYQRGFIDGMTCKDPKNKEKIDKIKSIVK